MLTQKNKTLTALDISGNHIGAFAPNSFNDHLPRHTSDNRGKLPKQAINKLGTRWLDQTQCVRNIPLRYHTVAVYNNASTPLRIS